MVSLNFILQILQSGERRFSRSIFYAKHNRLGRFFILKTKLHHFFPIILIFLGNFSEAQIFVQDSTNLTYTKNSFSSKTTIKNISEESEKIERSKVKIYAAASVHISGIEEIYNAELIRVEPKIVKNISKTVDHPKISIKKVLQDKTPVVVYSKVYKYSVQHSSKLFSEAFVRTIRNSVLANTYHFKKIVSISTFLVVTLFYDVEASFSHHFLFGNSQYSSGSFPARAPPLSFI